MTLTISLPSETERQLRERAAAAGQEVERYVEQLVVKELSTPASLVEACEPFARAVEASGISEEEFTNLIVEARDEVRRERRGQGR